MQDRRLCRHHRFLTAVGALVLLALTGCSDTGSGSSALSEPPTTESATTESPATTSTSAAIQTPTTVTAPATTTAAPPSSVAAPPTLCTGDGTTTRTDLAYDSISGVDPNLLSLDVYMPGLGPDCPPPPIMIYVHGGAWVTGDKTHNVDNKISWFNEMGWVLVSVNYRLTPEADGSDPADLDTNRVMFPTHNNDVANAVAWIRDNASRIGADPDAMSIMGHSAGGGIISAISTDETYLGDHGLGLDALDCAVSLDTAAYDIRARVEDSLTTNLYLNAFGDIPSDWDIASPLNHVEPAKNIPDFFIVVRGSNSRIAQAQDFERALASAGVGTQLIEAAGLSHDGVNEAIGSPDDSVITPELGVFLNSCR